MWSTPGAAHGCSDGDAAAAAAAADALRARVRLQVLRVAAKWLDGFFPRARRLLADCVLPPRSAAQRVATAGAAAASDKISLNVEAMGAGTVLVRGVRLPKTATLSELRNAIAARRQNTPADGQRLFLGQGGRELVDPDATLEESGVPDGAALVLMLVCRFQILVVVHGGTQLSRRSVITAVQPGPLGISHCVNQHGELMRLERTLLECNIGASGHFIHVLQTMGHITVVTSGRDPAVLCGEFRGCIPLRAIHDLVREVTGTVGPFELRGSNGLKLRNLGHKRLFHPDDVSLWYNRTFRLVPLPGATVGDGAWGESVDVDTYGLQ